MSWEKQAECRNHDPVIWYPPSDGSRKSMVAAAVVLCRKHCPVVARCAQFALDSERSNGVWGGVDLGDSARTKRTPEMVAALERVAQGVSS